PGSGARPPVRRSRPPRARAHPRLVRQRAPAAGRAGRSRLRRGRRARARRRRAAALPGARRRGGPADTGAGCPRLRREPRALGDHAGARHARPAGTRRGPGGWAGTRVDPRDDARGRAGRLVSRGRPRRRPPRRRPARERRDVADRAGGRAPPRPRKSAVRCACHGATMTSRNRRNTQKPRVAEGHTPRRGPRAAVFARGSRESRGVSVPRHARSMERRRRRRRGGGGGVSETRVSGNASDPARNRCTRTGAAYRASREPLTWMLSGVPFAATLLGILVVHEFGHYFTARARGAAVSLPFFIPAPPAIFMAGTLGAIIRMRSSVRDRNALFDIAA